MSDAFNLYLIRRPRRPCLLFASHDTVLAWEEASTDHVHQAIAWVRSRRNRFIVWCGNVLEGARAYHGALEDRLDPAERILRAMAGANSFVIHHGSFPSDSEVLGYFRAALRRQRVKHWIWFVLDGAAIVVALLLSPVLVPIPGPNVFLYYPVLRIFSHYRAVCGTRSAAECAEPALCFTPALDGLESQLQSPRRDRRAVRAAADALNVEGLGPFIERMVP